MRHSLTSIQKTSLALGIAGISVLVGVPAWAQSSNSSSAEEFKISKEGMRILCEVTPMNSRCEGSPYYSSSSPSSQSPSSPDNASPSGTTAPTQNLPSESDVPAPQAPGGMMQDGSPSDSDGTTTPPSNTTAPTENLPSESDVPSPQGQSPNGIMQGGSSPNSGSQDGVPPSSGTTAPTQNLPSESDVPSPMTR